MSKQNPNKNSLAVPDAASNPKTTDLTRRERLEAMLREVKLLNVPDAASLPEFLANAKAIWSASRGVTVSKPGRPRVQERIWQAIDVVRREVVEREWHCPPEASVKEADAEVARINKILSDARTVALVRAKLAQADDETPDDNTLKKYVKLYRLTRRPVVSLDTQEERWLKKYDTKGWTVLIDFAKGRLRSGPDQSAQ